MTFWGRDRKNIAQNTYHYKISAPKTPKKIQNSFLKRTQIFIHSKIHIGYTLQKTKDSESILGDILEFLAITINFMYNDQARYHL